MAVFLRPILTRVRRRLGDMQAVTYSEYELIDDINEAVKMLYIALADNGSEIPATDVELDLVAGRAPLPEDYYSMICASSVKGPHDPRQPFVDGSDIALPHEADGKVKLRYNRVPGTPAKAPTDEVHIPLSLAIDVAEIAVLIVRGDMTGAMATAIASAKRMGGRRECGAIPDQPWAR